MIKTFEEIGAAYRQKAKRMLDEVEKILPQIGIHYFTRSESGCRLQARIVSGGNRARELVFIAHPAAEQIEIAARCPEGGSGEERKYRKAVVNLKCVKDLRVVVERAVGVVLAGG